MLRLTIVILFGFNPLFALASPVHDSFAEWCLDRALTDEQKFTVQALLSIAGTSDCESAGEILNASTRLEIQGNIDVKDLGPIGSLTQLTHLYLNAGGVTDISALRKLTDLYGLSLWGSDNVKDWSPLNALNKLKSLSIGVGDSIDNVGFLSSLNSLHSLTIEGGAFEDLSGISELKTLGILELFHTRVTDLKDLSKLTGLKGLILTGDGTIELNIPPLKTLTKLSSIEFDYFNISDLTFVNTSPSLEVLSIYQGSIRNMSDPLVSATLRGIAITRSNVRDISTLSLLSNLERLALSHNQIENVSAISKLENLTRLSLDNNRIKDVTILSSLVNLERLNLKQNPLISEVCPVPDPQGVICLF